jgi:deferrochelatase/peroxidase EfeB
MSEGEKSDGISRRGLLVGGGLAGLGVAVGFASAPRDSAPGAVTAADTSTVPFYGLHQAGIATTVQDFLTFAAFDLNETASSTDLRDVLNSWSSAAALMTRGESLGFPTNNYDIPVDSGEAWGRPASALTVTIGYGASLCRDHPQLGLSAPALLKDLPAFTGDDIDATISNGDIAVQVCANDPQVAFHAVHTLARLGSGIVALRYTQLGFGRTSSVNAQQESARNLLGFKDGTNNLRSNAESEFKHHVWVGRDASAPYMVAGTYLIARKIRTRLESWSNAPLSLQEETIGRFKVTGAPLSGTNENDTPDLGALDGSGNQIIPSSAHIRLAAPGSNGGAKILRRGYGFSEGLDATTGEISCGLYFICFTSKPESFIKIQENLALNDALNNYTQHVSSTVIACPGGLSRGFGWGDQLFGR